MHWVDTQILLMESSKLRLLHRLIGLRTNIESPKLKIMLQSDCRSFAEFARGFSALFSTDPFASLWRCCYAAERPFIWWTTDDAAAIKAKLIAVTLTCSANTS